MAGPLSQRAASAARRAWRAAIDLVLPPVSLMGDEVVEASGRIAPADWARLVFLGDPQCARCGLPFAFDPGAGAVCGACAAAPPDFDRARAALAYDDASRGLVLELKHGARADGVATFAGWMAAALGAAGEAIDATVPVPLHPARLRARRFNQSALLARALARRLGLPFDPDLLMRRRDTPSQGGLSASGRARNVAGAFAVRPGAEVRVRGRRLLLVDDVFTTGATLSASARALKRAGAARVEAAALARVVRPRDALT